MTKLLSVKFPVQICLICFFLSFQKLRKNESNLSENKVTLPVYLNSNRSELLFTVDLEAGEKENKTHFYERGVAFILSSLN